MSKPQSSLPRAALVGMYRQVKEQTGPEAPDPRKDLDADRKTGADGAKLPPQRMSQKVKETKQARRKAEEEGAQVLNKKGDQTVVDREEKQVKGSAKEPEESEKDCRAKGEKDRAEESRKTEHMVRGWDKESKRTDESGGYAKTMKRIDDELVKSMRRIDMEFKKSMKQIESLPEWAPTKEGNQV